VPGDERRQFAGDTLAGDRRVWDRREALLGHVVDDVEHPEPLTGRHLVMNEVERPAHVRPSFDGHRRAGSDRSLATAANRQTFLAEDPLGPL